MHGWNESSKLFIRKDKPGRGERIRTSGLYVPNVALYQAKLHPDIDFAHASHHDDLWIESNDNSSRASRYSDAGKASRQPLASSACACAASRVASSAPVAFTMATI